ncbi:MAG: hypothetical protein Q9220_006731 [cf. Caloplaca sp. 1 TL-2023]
MSDRVSSESLDQLALGFGALLDQAQELDRHNERLEQLLDRMHEQAQALNPIESTEQHPSDSAARQQHHRNSNSDGSGLHIECKHNQLHLRKVSRENKWLIADGFKAWNDLCYDGVGPYPYCNRPPPRDMLEVLRTSRIPKGAQASEMHQKCPFPQAQGAVRDNTLSRTVSDNGIIHEEHVLPNGNMSADPIAAEARSATLSSSSSPPPSPTGSMSKCPIRFLDQHSPEEVAEYFKAHRHEIPRSHEICVKRYQRNEYQIRQLDHKYGSLVNMIQGLGLKHQPMLHVRTGGENISQGVQTTSLDKVEAWKEGFKDATAHDDGTTAGRLGQEDRGDDEGSEREGRFDRPLKEVRVGESPSRPWGISVPQMVHVPPSALSEHGNKQPEPPTPVFTTSPPSAEHLQQQQGMKPPPQPAYEPRRVGEGEGKQPTMVFTGPVFIGYDPAQIREMLQAKVFEGSHDL